MIAHDQWFCVPRKEIAWYPKIDPGIIRWDESIYINEMNEAKKEKMAIEAKKWVRERLRS